MIPSIQYHGFSLSSAYKREYHNLADADASAWPAIVPVAKKLAIVLCVSFDQEQLIRMRQHMLSIFTVPRKTSLSSPSTHPADRLQGADARQIGKHRGSGSPHAFGRYWFKVLLARLRIANWALDRARSGQATRSLSGTAA